MLTMVSGGGIRQKRFFLPSKVRRGNKKKLESYPLAVRT